MVASAPITGLAAGRLRLEDHVSILLEGALPFIWLTIWWFFISDHPRYAKWISAQEKNYLETTLEREAVQLEPPAKIPFWRRRLACAA